MNIPSRVAERLSAGVRRFQPVLQAAKARDVNESDTSIIVTDMLADVFGYDKYAEITSELMIRGTYCDLAIKLDGKMRLITEVKAIGTELKDGHVKQAIDYAANQGIEWVGLTNGVHWQIYRVQFAQPIGSELVVEFDFLALNSKSEAHIQLLYLLTREAIGKSALDEYHIQRQAMSRFFLGAVVLSEPVLAVVRRELRRVSPEAKIDIAELTRVLRDEVLKRDVIEGDRYEDARRKLSRSQGRSLRIKEAKEAGEVGSPTTVDNPPCSVPSATPAPTP